MIEEIIYAVIGLEMLLINMLFLDCYIKPRFNAIVRWTIYFIFTALIIFGSLKIFATFPNTGNGNGLFIFVGLLYALPVIIIYKDNIKKIAMVIFTIWVYTALGFTISVQIARLFDNQNIFCYLVLGFQTIFYLATILVYKKYFKKQTKSLLESLYDPYVRNKYLILVISYYFSIVLINYSLVTNNLTVGAITFIITGIMMSFSFYFIIHFVRTSKERDSLVQMAYHDGLTNIPNRTNFIITANELIKNKKPFHIIFMDLDNFKSINDTYGHENGNEYLRFFAKSIMSYFPYNGQLYRLYGDEFVLIVGDDYRKIENRMLTISSEMKKTSIKGMNFIGFSFGIANYPKNSDSLDSLLNYLDKQMYINKASKKK